MNLGQAVAVCLYELVRDRKRSAKAEKLKLATGAEIERLTEVLLESLHASGYLKPRARAATEEKIRRMVRRRNLSVEDTGLLLGMLRQISWKLNNSSN